jgi:type IV secretion system protein VirB1
VAHQTLAAIVKTESAFRPFAIGVNGGAKLARQPETKAEAVATANWLLERGYNIDMGLGQVNSANLKKTGLSVEDAFEPCKNIAASASILLWNYQAASKKVQGEQAALHAALSAYNTGSFTKGFSNGYVQKVVGNAGGVPPATVVPPIQLIDPQANKQSQKQTPPAQTSQVVKLQTEKQPEAQQQRSASVYSQNVERPSVMVYR